MQVILTHENADFDAIASLLGAHKLYPGAQPVLPRRINRNVQAFLALYRAELPFVDPTALPRGRHVRRVILVDTQSLTSVRGMGPKIDEVLVIDHHERPETLPEGWTFRGEPLGATTTMLVEALSTRLIPVTRIETTLLLAGIYEDTGSLTFPSTTSRDMRAAAWLLDRGASLEIVNNFLHHPLTPGQQWLYEQLLDRLETLQIEGHAVAVSWAQAPEGMDEEISTLAHKLRDLLEPSALFLLVGLDGNTQLVARSTTDDIDVSEVARHFGGRGHSRASAALLRDRALSGVLAELREILPRFVRPRLTVRDLMSHGVRTVTPYTSIADLFEQMQQTGHEGYPVVDDQGNVVGLVTRTAVDRAVRHHWSHFPVQRIMDAGAVTVAPEDSAERVRTLMIEKGWGQIPVVDGARVAGVVTRTDLIRLPPSEREQERQQIALRMEHAFPARLLALIRRVGQAAAEQNDQLYFVGGIVRDLLLGQPIVDVDLVVEGDAIALCRALTQHYGGEMRKHTRFGTAKWLLTPEIWETAQTLLDETPPPVKRRTTILPEFIDFVTARTEFYTQPTALPTVEWSSIKQDLHRRDFTINTLAIRLSPGHWGELLDFFGGQDDLENGIIRVLHSLSFVEDPTRILRAARFETRLDFHLDPRSEALIAEALPLLDRVTGGRIRHELEVILREAHPEAALERLHDLGALQQIDPEFTHTAENHAALVRLRETLDPQRWTLDEDERLLLQWALLFFRLDCPALNRIAQRLMMPRKQREALFHIPSLRQIMAQLPGVEQPSEIVTRLEYVPAPLLAAGWLMAKDDEVRKLLERYWMEWQHIQPELTGEDFKALDLEPGPLYRELFAALRQGRLDGTLGSRDDEIALVRRLTAVYSSDKGTPP
ncbi:MAG: CBS domain-containing protein [Anaerolineae bacterium]|nr:CBS domain-containing protein [Anaerolineae bacterium]